MINSPNIFICEYLKGPQKKSDLHLWADLVELACIYQPDGMISCESAIIEPLGLKGVGGDFRSDDDIFIDEGIDTVLETERDDEVSVIARDLIQYLITRSELLGFLYPFAIDDNSGIVTYKEKLNQNHLLYIYFLFSANLRLFSLNEQHLLTRDFELISAFALKSMLPPSAEIRHFGTANNQRFKGYSGNKKKKLSDLAADLKTITRLTGLPSFDSGDAGIDLVGWLPFDDSAPFMPSYFAQCACTADDEEMLKKQYGVSAKEIGNMFDRVFPSSIMFTPSCYRNGEGTWVKIHRISSIFIDRIRLMKLLSQNFKSSERKHISSLTLTLETLKTLDISIH